MPNAADDQPRDGNGNWTRDPATAERDALICRMRRDGKSLRAIGTTLGMHHKSVAEALARALREIVEEPATDLRRLEAERLDHYLTRLTPNIDGGDDKAISAALRIAERRARLFGLDAPKQLDIAMDQRLDLEAATVADAITAALDALDLTPEQHATAIAAAQTRLSENTETD